MSRVALAVVTLFAACSSQASSTLVPPVSQPAPIDAAKESIVTTPPDASAAAAALDAAAAAFEVTISATPNVITRATRKQFMLSYTVTNRAAATVDPQLGLSVLSVNGKTVDDWNFRLGNSGHDRKFSQLPAGQSITEEWDVEAYFPKPGQYIVTLTVSSVTSAPIEILVK